MSADTAVPQPLSGECAIGGGARLDFQRIFQEAPGCFMVLAPDGPRFTILAATDAYLRATKTQREAVVGKGVFEVFPDNPDDPATKAVDYARASFQRVVDTRRADVMGIRKHDIRRPQSEGGGFEVRYWDPVNYPVLGPDGQVACIIHRVEDATEAMRQKQRHAEQQAANVAMRDSRRAALNLMEDAVAARRQAEEVNAALRQEVAERKRAEEELRRKEEELREAQRVAHIGNWYWDARTDATTGSDELLRIYGFDPQTQAMPDFRDQKGLCYHPEDWERVNAAVASAMQTGVGYELDVRAFRGREAIWVTTRGEVARDAASRIVGLRGTVQDITVRKAAEEALAADLAATARLQQIGARFVKAGELAGVLGEILDAAIAIAHSDMGNIQLFDAQTGSLKIAAYRGFEQPFRDFWNAVAEGRGACGTAMRNAQRVIVEDVAQSPIFVGTPALEVQIAAGVRAVQSTPLFGHSGALIGMLSTHWHVPHRPEQRDLHLLDLLAQEAVDIIEFARAEELLRESRDELEIRVQERTAELAVATAYNRSLIEASPDPLVTIGRDGTITDVNTATEQATGRTREQLIGTDFSAYFTDPEMARVGYQQVFREGSVHDYPLEIRRADGHLTAVLYNAVVYRDPAGNPVGVFAAARDITKRKRAEQVAQAERQRLFDVLETLPVYVVLLTADYHVPFANRFFEERFGKSQGRRCYEYLFGRGEPCEICETYKVLKEHRPQRWEWTGPDGRTYDIYDFPFTDSDGSQMIMEMGIDITEQRKAEAALREVNETLERRVTERTAELERSNEDLQHFAYIASHDLQEPLRMVSGFLKLLEDRYRPQLDARAQQYIDYSVEGSMRMSQLIADLLAFSRVDIKGEQFRPVDAGAALAEALANLRGSIEEAGAQVTWDPLPTVTADGTQLMRLLQNLVGNAIKFRDPDRPCQVHVAAQRQDGRWVFSVRDNGIGVDPRHQDRIFVIFQRLHTRAKYPGTGIGLAICKRIVERHGGRIWVESRPGDGSTFYFTMPAGEPAGG